jgi:nitrogen fixation protein NifU and related proteins
MPDLDALYQEIILDHNRRPRNYGELPGAERTVAGRNPLCGDEMTLWVRMDADRIADARFVAQGCAISKASASLMTTAVKGKTREEAEQLFERVHRLVTGKLSEEERGGLGPLAALGGVAKFPIRVKCASLPWHALKQALAGAPAKAPVTTE